MLISVLKVSPSRVALRKESVDRNVKEKLGIKYYGRRSPQGERG